jgi:CcmD family protein
MRTSNTDVGQQPRGRSVAGALALAAFTLIFSAGLWAFQQPPAEGFVPVDQLPVQEQLPAAPLVMAAYAIAWLAVFGYLWSIWRRLGKVEREIADVSRRVDAGARR